MPPPSVASGTRTINEKRYGKTLLCHNAFGNVTINSVFKMNNLLPILLLSALLLSCGNPKQPSAESVPFVSFWDGFDFADSAMINNPGITEPRFKDFLTLLESQSDSSRRQQIDTLLVRSHRGSRGMFLHILSLADKYLTDPNSTYRNEETYLPFLEYALEYGDLDETLTDHYRFQIANIHKNRVGTLANDFPYLTREGNRGTLHAISTPYTLIYFNNPDCHDCARISSLLASSEVLTRLTSSGTLTLLALYPDKDLTSWQHHLSDSFPTSWIIARYAPDTDHNLYDLPAIPSLYLLDSKKQVLLKDATFEEVEIMLRFP